MTEHDFIEKAKKIKCVICDVDGVLTDGSLYLDSAGNELKAFQVLDGVGLKLLMYAGIEVAVITGAVTSIIDHRMKQLKIEHYFKGQVNKQQAYDTLKSRLNLTDEAFAYIGDDLPDLPLIQQVGLGVAVANAVSEVKQVAAWQTTRSGGKGAVREVCDKILYTQHKFELALARYLAT
jgi:3-deoxy-D-manno-octulosonate 8-phosphate phosphatase (KDO 8-P phosphatase)